MSHPKIQTYTQPKLKPKPINNSKSKTQTQKSLNESISSDCLTCADPIQIYAIGKCNHKEFCYICTIRMRQLYGNIKCPICKTDLETVIYSENPEKNFENYKQENLLFDDNLKSYYENKKVKDSCEKVWEISCSVFGCQQTFPSIENLKSHLKNKHQLTFCDICLEQKPIFLFEQKHYTNEALKQHMKTGDTQKSPNQTPFHPWCQFCQWFALDGEKLYEHMKNNHHTCQICEQMGRSSAVYYRDYSSLKRHYSTDHFPCDDPQCYQDGIAFANEFDLRAHKLAHATGKVNNHNNNTTRNRREIRDLSRVPAEIFFFDPPRQRGRRGGPQEHGTNTNEQSYNSTTTERESYTTSSNQISLLEENDFPSLINGNTSNNSLTYNQNNSYLRRANQSNNKPIDFSSESFPALSSPSNSSREQPAPTPQKNAKKGKKQKEVLVRWG